MRIDIVTIFPEYFAPLDRLAHRQGGAARRHHVAVHDLRAWTHDVHHTVDDSPFGGGPAWS